MENDGQPPRIRGVVRRKRNGNWGAQIGVDKTVMWLGTHATEADAGVAYDRASLKLQRYSSLNFPSTSNSCIEKRFQSFFSFETIVSMIRQKTYSRKYELFVTRNPAVAHGACHACVESNQQNAEEAGSGAVTEAREPVKLFGARIG